MCLSLEIVNHPGLSDKHHLKPVSKLWVYSFLPYRPWIYGTDKPLSAQFLVAVMLAQFYQSLPIWMVLTYLSLSYFGLINNLFRQVQALPVSYTWSQFWLPIPFHCDFSCLRSWKINRLKFFKSVFPVSSHEVVQWIPPCWLTWLAMIRPQSTDNIPSKQTIWPFGFVYFNRWGPSYMTPSHLLFYLD